MSLPAMAMTANEGRRGTRFIHYHDFAASFALHALLTAPLILSRVEPDKEDRHAPKDNVALEMAAF
ncbi:hypothetical+protein [Methylocapsa aurea]|uniref:hypothetical protein n=1 Tax=Methylocapsa aurea TaxID=663610 RepID=UPI003D18D3E3